jgi:hypothetical protein
MSKLHLRLHDQAVELHYPASVKDDVELLLGQLAIDSDPASGGATVRTSTIAIREHGPDRYSITADSEHGIVDLDRVQLLIALLEEVVRSLVVELDTAVALHAGTVSWNDRSILIAGTSGAGKSSMVAWFAAKKFQYHSDELAILNIADGSILGFQRPLLLKQGSAGLVSSFPIVSCWPKITAGTSSIFRPERSAPVINQGRPCAMVIFPQFVKGAELEIVPIGPAQCGLKLMECNLNGRNLPNHGFTPITVLARSVAAIEVRYGDFEQIDGVLDTLAKFALEEGRTADDVRRFLLAFDGGGDRHKAPQADTSTNQPAQSAATRSEIPSPTLARFPRKLTIGMATYDDYDGVYFTLQAMRLYHSEILDETEFVVVDNNPTGPAAQTLKNFEGFVPNYRYVPDNKRSGTAIRDSIFQEASGEFVMCVDCHVLIVENALTRLFKYLDANPDTIDLMQGPLLHDDTHKLSTHFNPEWQAGMYGTWATNSAAEDLDADPFDIPMQGLGVFACRRAIWPGFNPHFRGFGGEEGYIHEKFRRAGGRTLCLPFLRWMHRFQRPLGLPYRNTWEDRLRNYIIGFNELGLDTAELEAHFKGLLGEAAANRVIESVKAEFKPTDHPPAKPNAS